MGLLLSFILLPIKLLFELIEIAARSSRRRRRRPRARSPRAPVAQPRTVSAQSPKPASVAPEPSRGGPAAQLPRRPLFTDLNAEGREWYRFDHSDTTAMVLAVAEYVLTTQYAMPAMLQRMLKISYRDADESLDVLEMIGAVGPFRLGKPRDVLIPAVATQVTLDFIRDGVEISRQGPTSDR